jgi:thiol-disulfide isomerase/thioredoxin
MPRIAASLAILMLLAVPSRAAGSHKKPIDRVALTKLITLGSQFLQTGRLGAAMKDFQKADKLSHHTCVTCYLAIARIKQRVGDISGALHEAKHALKVPGQSKQTRAGVLQTEGILLAELAHGAKDKKLKRAEADFRQALGLDPSLSSSRFDLGVMLLRQKRDAEGIAQLKSYLAAPNTIPSLNEQARQMIANPDRAREPFAPDFSITTLEGRTITSNSLAGKVVLLDFWATWCPPCRASVPMVAAIEKKYSGRPVEIIGVSSDSNKQKWKAFVAGHHMDWAEFLDLSGQMQSLFRVNAFPTYIVIDREGIIRFRTEGYGTYAFTEAHIEDAIDKALKRSEPKQ